MGIRILHLSDLHISSREDNSFTILRNSILKYIQEKNVEADIIAFTGDIIDRNDQTAFPIAIEFFKSLLEICNLESNRLMIVPGNHDMKRDDTLRNILDPEKIKFDEYVKENWAYLKVRMQGYSDFVKELGIADKKEFEDGYGVKIVQIGGKTICFNLLNSAWSSRGNDDYRSLAVGRWQLEKNRAELEKITNKDIVITMLHHPLAWLTDVENNMMRDYLCHHGKLGSYLLLHGHIHDSKTQREMTPAGGFTTLITGIGYPKAEEREANQPKICECKFSIYDIDIENNMVDNFCLTSTTQGDFVPDTRLYNGSEDGHYKFPLGSMQEITMKGQENECMELDPVPVINCWSGRTEEFDLLSKENTNVIAISGVGGQGKTALAAKFMRETPVTFCKGLFESNSQKIYI
ncbi:metallophosphoesterase [Candidatus Merdisoma sp. JLR.KK006]|uniref:metallophosphoesterase family protein n=1 Tax=Candidatus Merdisoma sp. JLR.KK006 TaxID=3112626 RepID=UPI002FF03D5F